MEIKNERNRDYLKKIPNLLVWISGFNSCLTVSFNSVLYIYTVYHMIIDMQLPYPNVMKFVLMLAGPLVLALHYVNAKSVLAVIFSELDKTNIADDNSEGIVNNPVKTPTKFDTQLEIDLFGPTFTILRSIAGFISVHAICVVSIVSTVTIHMAVLKGKPLPSDMIIFVVLVGPVLTSWTFMKAGTTISALLKSKKIKSFIIDKAQSGLDKLK